VSRGFRSLKLIGFASFFLGELCADPAPESIQKLFAPFAIQKSLRNRFEGIEVKGKSLELKLWYEDSSVTKTGEPADEVICRAVHTLIYGRHRDRNQNRAWPLTEAFAAIPQAETASIQFFAVLYTNKPHPPTNASQLRVMWEREEKIIPYLSYEISKSEWLSLSKLLKAYPALNHEEFQKKLCSDVVRRAPHVKANFKELQSALKEARGNDGK